MHELGIAQSIVEQSLAAALEAGVHRVTAVRIRVGELSGVSLEALQSCWPIATNGTMLEMAKLDAELVRVTLDCHQCHAVVSPPEMWNLVCSQCGWPAHLVTGRELQLDSLECPE